MKLSVELPDTLQITRLDFGYIEAHIISGPYSCWLQSNGRMYRGNGNSLQEAFDMMKLSLDKNEPIFTQRQSLAKKKLEDLF